MRTSVNAIVTLQTMPMNLNLLTPSKEGSIASVIVQLIPLTGGEEDAGADAVDGRINVGGQRKEKGRHGRTQLYDRAYDDDADQPVV